MKYFVTGATGFIGGHLALKLVAQGHQVTCLVRNAQGAKAETLAKMGATLAEGDIGDRSSLSGPLQGMDGVFHLAALYELGYQYRARMTAINVDGTRNVLEAAVEAGVPRIVHTSTVGVFGNTRGQIVDETYRIDKDRLSSEYERTKWTAHYEVALPMMQHGAPITIVQPGGVSGPGDTSPASQIFEFYLRRTPMMFGAKSGLTWAHVDDISDGHILAMQKGKIGESYIVAGPAMTYKETMEAWQKITGIPAPKIWMPGWVAGSMAVIAGVLERAVNVKMTFSAEELAILNDYTFYGNAEKARRELGWQPRPVEALFKEVLDYELAKMKK